MAASGADRRGDEPLLSTSQLTIWRGEHCLADEIELAIYPSDLLQIEGSNGSGKTTLLRALIGLAEFDEGEVRWLGKPLHEHYENLYQQLLYLGHKPGISPGLTPFENLLSLCPELSAGDPEGSSLKERIVAILAELGIEDRVDLPAAALSAGQKRRVALARLKLQQARLWVLDEPLTSLDSDGYEWVRRQISQQVRQGGSVIFTTHQPIDFDDLPVRSLRLASGT